MKSIKAEIKNGRGGRRPGAGRKPGSVTKKSRKAADAVAASGATPLDVMVADMRFHYTIAQEEISKGSKANRSNIAAALSAARAAAKDAAPYTHARLAAIEHMGKGGGPIEVVDARSKLAYLVTRADEAGAEGGDT